MLDNFRTGRRENIAAVRSTVGEAGFTLLEGSITDAAAVARAMEGCTVVHHLAAQVPGAAKPWHTVAQQRLLDEPVGELGVHDHPRAAHPRGLPGEAELSPGVVVLGEDRLAAGLPAARHSAGVGAVGLDGAAIVERAPRQKTFLAAGDHAPAQGLGQAHASELVEEEGHVPGEVGARRRPQQEVGLAVAVYVSDGV